MINLISISDTAYVITSAAGNVSVHTSWVDLASGSVTPGRTNTAAITTATTTTVVAAPAASTYRNIKYVTIKNHDAAVTNIVEFYTTDGTTAIDHIQATLTPLQSLVFSDNCGWQKYSATGAALASNDYPATVSNASTASFSTAFSADTYLTGSAIVLPTGILRIGTMIRWSFDMVKTAAGVATPIITIRFGTAGTTADTSRCAFTFAAGTGVADTARFEIMANFRSVGSGVATIIAGTCSCYHSLAATGMTTTGASGFGQITTIGGGFDSTVAGSTIGLSFNGGTSFAGTNNVVQTIMTT
jgi:hypothetical protein